jgi:hypothetical protein
MVDLISGVRVGERRRTSVCVGAIGKWKAMRQEIPLKKAAWGDGVRRDDTEAMQASTANRSAVRKGDAASALSTFDQTWRFPLC